MDWFKGVAMGRILVLLGGFLYLSQCALGWNSQGHQVVAQIAYNHLDPEVKARCDALLQIAPVCGTASLTFISDSTWADQRCQTGTSPEHYIDIPISLDGYPTNQVVDTPTNVVNAIRDSIAILQNPNASPSAQSTALRYLLHFVGDIQQPLHSSTGVTTNQPTGDSGGNGFSLGGSNLHSFWDGGGGYLTDGASVASKAADVEASYPYAKSIGAIPDPMTWAFESREIARTNTYVGVTRGSAPSSTYSNMTKAVTKQRMAIGGQRLAKLLNSIMVTNTPALTSVTITDGNFVFTWGSVSGRTYRVQSKNSVGDPSWTDEIDITATNGAASFSQPVGGDQKLYRAVVVN